MTFHILANVFRHSTAKYKSTMRPSFSSQEVFMLIRIVIDAVIKFRFKIYLKIQSSGVFCRINFHHLIVRLPLFCKRFFHNKFILNFFMFRQFNFEGLLIPFTPLSFFRGP